jgi:ABC-2 type transport system permease protein
MVVNFIPRQRKVLLLATAVGAIVIAAVVVQQVYWVAQHAPLERESNARLLDRISFARSVHMPSHWAASGLRTSARNGPGDIGQTLYYLGLVWSNGLVAYLLTTWSSKHLYRRGVNRIVTGGSLRRRYGASRLDQLLAPALVFLDARTRLLLVKDFRTFRRDPAQWSQVLIFSGLLVLAFANIGFLSGPTPWPYVNCISAANVLLIGLLVAVYNGRFIFPLLSLEGRKFWILGLLPIDRAQLLWGKFFFSAAMTVGFAEVLALFSDLMLRMPATIVLLHAVTVLLLAIGLSGMSVGLGAALADFRETNPSKIASGFGGTLNSIVGLLYLLAIFAVVSGPWHLAMMFDSATELTPAGVATVGAGVLTGLVIGFIALIWPLRLGIHTIRRREF